MPALGMHDPLALYLVSNDQIIAKCNELSELPVSLTDTIQLLATTDEISRLKAVIDTWDIIGSETQPYRFLDGTTQYGTKEEFTQMWQVIVQLKARRYSRLYTYADALITQNNATHDVTERDIYDTSWPSFDSNIFFNVGSAFAPAKMDPLKSHADIALSSSGGSANNIVDNPGPPPGAPAYRTVLTDMPIYRPSYWEIEVTGNIGDIYIGICNTTPNLAAAYRLGDDANSVGVRINDETIKDALHNGAVIPLTDYDATKNNTDRDTQTGVSGHTDTQHIIGLRYDPFIGQLAVCWGRENDWQVVGTGYNSPSKVGSQPYAAITIYEVAGVVVQARMQATQAGSAFTPDTGSDLQNYGNGYFPPNLALNYAKGLFTVNENP